MKLLPLLLFCLLATPAIGQGDLESQVDAVLAVRPASTSHANPLAHDKMSQDDYRRSDVWNATGWSVVTAEGLTATPYSDSSVHPLPETTDHRDVATTLVFLQGSPSPVPRDATLLADLALAQALEDVVGRATGHGNLDIQRRQVEAFGRDPVNRAARDDLFDLVLSLGDRTEELWDRATFLLAAGLLSGACSPSDLPETERLALVDAADRLLRAILELRPDSSPALNLRGHAALWTGLRSGDQDWLDEAVAIFARGIQSEPRDPYNVVALAQLYRIQGDPARALATVSSSLGEFHDFPKRIRARLLRVAGALQLELDVEAPHALARSYRLYHDSLRLHRTLEAHAAVKFLLERAAAGDWEPFALDVTVERAWGQAAMAREILDAAQELGRETPTPAHWLRGYRPALEAHLTGAIAVLASIDADDVRDDLIEELHWAWNAYFEATEDLDPGLRPSHELTQATRGLVLETNERRWKAKQLKTRRYDEWLGQEI